MNFLAVLFIAMPLAPGSLHKESFINGVELEQ